MVYTYGVTKTNFPCDWLMGTINPSNNDNYPPMDIIKLSDDGDIELNYALAGFLPEEITVTQNNRELVVSGKRTGKDAQYLHKGIGTRKFRNTFTMSEYSYVSEASFINGILSIKIVRDIPEEKKPKNIEIKTK